MAMRRSHANTLETERGRQTDQSGLSDAEPSSPGGQAFVAAYRDFTEETDLAALALDPDELFGTIRKEAVERNFEL